MLVVPDHPDTAAEITAIQATALAGSFQYLFRGDLINAYIGLRYGASAQIFGAPDTNRGQFGYDVGPVLAVVGGAVGRVRSLAASTLPRL